MPQKQFSGDGHLRLAWSRPHTLSFLAMPPRFLLDLKINFTAEFREFFYVGYSG